MNSRTTHRDVGNHLSTQFFTSVTPSSELKRQFVDALWPKSACGYSAVPESNSDFDPYFALVEAEAQPTLEQHNAIKTYDDIVFIVGILRNHCSSTLVQIRDVIRTGRPSLTATQPRLSRSIELSIRLWLLCNVRNVMPLDRHSLQTSIPWPEDASLQSVLDQAIRTQVCDPSASFPRHLNLYDMDKIGQIRVDWTNDLTSHLTMRGSVLSIFHNVSALKRMRGSDTFILPKPFIDETLATIDLLIPFTKASSNTWLAHEMRRAGLDGNLTHRNPPDQRKSTYVYWQDRLLIIEETFDRTKPRSILQWWHDTRDVQQWWAFWGIVAGLFLTVLFGLIQSITGIIQVTQ